YTNWATAATNIQDAIDAAANGDTVLVSKGVYQTGSRLDLGGGTNRLYDTKLITIRSANGPAVTIIDGGGHVRCVYLVGGAVLSGFTLTNGYTSYPTLGAGAAGGGTLTNCVLVGNSGSPAVIGGVLYN